MLGVGLVAFAWALALAAGVSDGLLGILFFVPLGTWVVGLLVATLVAFLVGASRAATEGLGAFGLALTLAAALIIGTVGTPPVMNAAQDAYRVFKQSPRATIATELIAHASREKWGSEHDFDLPEADQWLSDSGQVTVINDNGRFSVMFWDFRGILDSYTASLYSNDVGASAVPGGEVVDGEPQYLGGHWWISRGD